MTNTPEILVITPMSPAVVAGCRKIGPVREASRDEVVNDGARAFAGIRAAAVWDCVVDEGVLEHLPALEIVANLGVGYDKIDVAAATARGIAVTHTPDVLTEEVADLAVGLLVMTVRRLGEAERFLRAGRWAAGAFPLTSTLRDRRVGVLGMGRIGRAIASRLEAFKLEVAYCARRQRADLPYPFYADPRELASGVDTLICVLPGGDETRGVVDAEMLRRLGPLGVLINVGRGSSVDEGALIEALDNGVIAGAGLDVFEREPLTDSPLMKMSNVVLLPHVGTATVHTRGAMAQLVVDNIAAWLESGCALTPTPQTRAAGLDARTKSPPSPSFIRSGGNNP